MVVVALAAVSSGCFAGLAAGGAAYGIVLETFFAIELLFTFCEDEIGSAILTLQLFVGHNVAP